MWKDRGWRRRSKHETGRENKGQRKSEVKLMINEWKRIIPTEDKVIRDGEL